MNLDVEDKDMAANIGQHIGFNQNIPKPLGIFGADLALIRAGKSVDGENWVVAEDDLVADIVMRLQRCFQPLGLDMALAAEAGPERMDEDQEKITMAHPIGQAFLLRWSVLGSCRTSRKICSLISS